ncbi:hypothetical protein KI387_014020, partial [Taxus chinensis]
YEMINKDISELDLNEKWAHKMQDHLNSKIQKLRVPVMEENTTTNELLRPFEEHVKKAAGDPLSFSEDTLESLFGIRVTISFIAEKHQSWFEKCKDINDAYDGWTESLSCIRIPHVDK